MNIRLTVLLFGIYFGVGDGLRCYVCGEDEDQSCDDFETSRDSYAKVCEPPNDKGCKTETEGGKIVGRYCKDVSYNRCDTLNKVLYCLCSTDLCNGNITILKYVAPTDDEDLLEGSGTKILSPTTEKPNATAKVSSGGGEIHVSWFTILVPFIIHIVKE